VPLRVFGQLVAIGLAAAGLAWGVEHASLRSARRPWDAKTSRASGVVRLAARKAEYLFHPGAGSVIARTKDGALSRTLDLSLVVDGDARPLTLERGADRATDRNAFGASFGVAIGDEVYDALLALRVDPATGALAVDLEVKGPPGAAAHAFALRLDVPADPGSVFVSGVGELGDVGAASGTEGAARAVEVDAASRAFAIVPAAGVVAVAAAAPDDPSLPMRVSVTTVPHPAPLPLPQSPGNAEPSPPTPPPEAPGTPVHAGLRFVFGDSSQAIWQPTFALGGERTARLHGVVAGIAPSDPKLPPAAPLARVYGLDSEGQPRVRASVDADGRFDLEAPTSVSLWYAAIDPTRSSTPVSFPPGTPWDLRLDVSPGGEIAARIVDGDTGEPVVARLLVHGIDGTLDPSFGPDYRASGAGPLLDTRTGLATTPLPAGRYRVAATKGIEWSIDAKTVEVHSGHSVPVELSIRHVVPTPGVVSCDLHVHARPSFDTPVLAEDRVLSLVSAGIDFAVPSEHNIVGDYGPALDAQDLTHDLATVTGVEITTFAPRFGHFGLFPYPVGKAPPYRGTNVNTVFNFVHKHAPPNAVLQVNHPRLPKGIGYFEIFRFDPKKGTTPLGMRTDFDTLEVYNGYEMFTPDRVDNVIHDWFALLGMGHRYAATGSSDSHRIQYQWAGYPRTMAVVGAPGLGAGDAAAAATSPSDAAGDNGGPLDTQAVVAAIKKGHAFVTSGPMIDFELNGARPGDDLTTLGPDDTTLRGHVTVRAAPWVDVSRLEVVVGGKTIQTVTIPSRPLALGPEAGTRAEVQARTVRFDEDVTVPVGLESTFVVVTARGTRKMDDILPFMPITPLAFTNPVYITRTR
jgi:hypothetical protein